VSAFSFLAGLGATLGLWQVTRTAQLQHTRRLADYGLLVLLLALVGARLFYVALHASYYSAHLAEALAFWQGGLSWPGAVAAGLMGVAGVALVKRRSFAWLADGLAPLIGPLAVGLWLGCWQAGVAYGATLPPYVLWAIPAPDESGTLSLRFPLQLLSAVFLLVYMWIADRLTAPRTGPKSRQTHISPPGRRAALFGFGLGLDLLAASLLRADPVPLWGALHVDTWCALGLLALSLAGLAGTFVKIKEREE
jgi:phosphatidylglycerol:prolipoprotein diacylglycerol transferase